MPPGFPEMPTRVCTSSRKVWPQAINTAQIVGRKDDVHAWGQKFVASQYRSRLNRRPKRGVSRQFLKVEYLEES